MLFKISISALIITCCYFIKLSKQDEINDSSQTNQLITDVVLLKESLKVLLSDVDKLHDILNIHTDLVNDINSNVLLVKNSKNQYEKLDKFFDNIETKLMDMRQNIAETLNKNNNHNQYINKQDANTQAVNDCPYYCTVYNTSKDVIIEIRNKIDERFAEYDKQMERFDILEEKLNISNMQVKTQLTSHENLDHKSQDLETLLREIHYKLNFQEEKLKSVDQQLPMLRNVASRVDKYTSSRKDKSRCTKEKCLLYSDFEHTSKVFNGLRHYSKNSEIK